MVVNEWEQGWLSLISFGWISGLVKLGAKRPLVFDDLGELPWWDQSAPHAKTFEEGFKSKGSVGKV
jgi:hypothetical protein